LKTDDGQPPNWFEISDGSKANERSIAPLVYVKAEAKIVDKDTIEVWSPKLKNPKFVRFAWHALARHNLVNGEGIPAISFRTDKLPQMWNRR
jgi:sialate O-acetylesterase